jgi:DNA-directed RNA polymerase sigma subunit (sigma70/sigma32)
VSAERIRQIEQKAMAKMQVSMLSARVWLVLCKRPFGRR